VTMTPKSTLMYFATIVCVVELDFFDLGGSLLRLTNQYKWLCMFFFFFIFFTLYVIIICYNPKKRV